MDASPTCPVGGNPSAQRHLDEAGSVPAALSLHLVVAIGLPRPADARIDNAEKDGSHRKPCGIGRQQIRRCLRIADWRIGEEVDNGVCPAPSGAAPPSSDPYTGRATQNP